MTQIHKMLLFTFVFLAVFAGTSANLPYSPEKRQQYIRDAVSSLWETTHNRIENLKQQLTSLDENKCRSAFESFTVRCLTEEMEKVCGTGGSSFQKPCKTISDILVVNKVNEKLFISRDERIQMSQSSKSYGFDYAQLLSKKYSLLTTEFLLLSKNDCAENDAKCLSNELDSYCLKNSDVKNIPWQACVSAVLWVIGQAK